jgi:adenylate cyclase
MDAEMPTDGTGNAKVERRLAAILAADIAGYSALMGADEEATVRDLKAHQCVILPMIKESGGRVIDTAGDGVLAEFASVLNAVKCAVALQKTMAHRNAAIDHARRMQFRIGINQGDVVFDEARVYGDGINIAARLEGIAEPGGICLSGKVYDEVEGRIDLTCEDLGAKQLKNIERPVRVYRVVAGSSVEASPSLQKDPLALPDKPSIAVLPFTNLSGDPSQDYFSDGITEDIITELSRFSELFVIARNSSFQYKGKSPDIRQVGRELGVRYVLEGSIRRSGDRVRISGQLIDAGTGAHRWAERYDRKLEDVLAVQDEVARTIVGILAAHVSKAEIERTLVKPAATWQASDYYMRAANTLASFRSSLKMEELYEARRFLEHALSVDPNYARAHAELSRTYTTAFVNSIDADFLNQAALDRAYQSARKAVQLDPNLSQAHADLGYVLTYKRQNEAAIAEFERAIALNPNYTDWRFASALVYAGEPAKAIAVVEAHIRLDPFYAPVAPGMLGLAYYMLRRYAKALPLLRECVLRAPNFRAGHIWLAATYAQLGQLEEARAEAAEILRIEPKFTITGTQRISVFKVTEDADHFSDGLRKAGLPEK